MALDTPSADEVAADLAELLLLQSRRTESTSQAAVASLGRGAVRAWYEQLLRIIREDRLNPIRASRALALLGAAVHDAEVASCQTSLPGAPRPVDLEPALEPLIAEGRRGGPSPEAAIGAAAHAILLDLSPDGRGSWMRPSRSSQEAPMVAGIATRSSVEEGALIGDTVGALAVDRASSDGSDAVWDGEVPQGEGLWVAAPSAVGPPVEAAAGEWRSWLLPER